MNGFNFSFSVGLVAAGPAVLTGPRGQALPAADVNVACHRPPGTALAWAKPLARLVLMPLKASKIKPGLLLPAPVPRRRGPAPFQSLALREPVCAEPEADENPGSIRWWGEPCVFRTPQPAL